MVLEEGSETLIRIAIDSTDKLSIRVVAIIGIAAILIGSILGQK
jgi:hypothetical protein